MKAGEYVLLDVGDDQSVGYIAEECPGCNGAKKVGGRQSPIIDCPICKGQGVVLTRVPVDEARAWLDKQLKTLVESEEFKDGKTG